MQLPPRMDVDLNALRFSLGGPDCMFGKCTESYDLRLPEALKDAAREFACKHGMSLGALMRLSLVKMIYGADSHPVNIGHKVGEQQFPLAPAIVAKTVDMD